MFAIKNNKLILISDYYQYSSHELSAKEIEFCRENIVGKTMKEFSHISYPHQHTFDGGLLNQYIKTSGLATERLIELQEIEDSI